MSGLLGKRLIIGSMSASNTALPRMRAATAIDIVDSGEIPVPFSINTRTNATICRATKKKIVGGSNLKNSSFSFFMSVAFGGDSPHASRPQPEDSLDHFTFLLRIEREQNFITSPWLLHQSVRLTSNACTPIEEATPSVLRSGYMTTPFPF